MSGQQQCLTPARLKAHLDGTLPGHEQQEVITHLDNCAVCQNALVQMASGGDVLLDVALDVGREPPEGTFHVRPEAWSSDKVLAGEVRVLAGEDYTFVGTPTGAASQLAAAPGTIIGPYRLIREI